MQRYQVLSRYQNMVLGSQDLYDCVMQWENSTNKYFNQRIIIGIVILLSDDSSNAMFMALSNFPCNFPWRNVAIKSCWLIMYSISIYNMTDWLSKICLSPDRILTHWSTGYTIPSLVLSLTVVLSFTAGVGNENFLGRGSDEAINKFWIEIF